MLQLTSIVCSLLILLNSSGLTYTQHFCNGLEVESEITFSHKNLSCGMPMEGTEMGKKSCCKNDFTTIDLDDDFSPSSSTFYFDVEPADFHNVGYCDLLIIEERILIDKGHIYYRPPPIEYDLTILYQTFLI